MCCSYHHNLRVGIQARFRFARWLRSPIDLHSSACLDHPQNERDISVARIVRNELLRNGTVRLSVLEGQDGWACSAWACRLLSRSIHLMVEIPTEVLLRHRSTENLYCLRSRDPPALRDHPGPASH